MLLVARVNIGAQLELDQQDHRQMPASLKGRALFQSGFGVTDLHQLQVEDFVMYSVVIQRLQRKLTAS